MLLPYLQVNAADYAHEKREFFFELKKILQNINRMSEREALNLWLQHFAERES